MTPVTPNTSVGAPALLAAFNNGDVLAPIDIRAAMTISRLFGETDETVLLAAALAVRATRSGHVRLELESAPASVVVDAEDAADVEALPWPEPTAWVEAVRRSRLTETGGPLQLDGSALYLCRYRAYEDSVAAEFRRRLAAPLGPPTPELGALIDRLVPVGKGDAGEIEADRQRLATVLGQLRPLLVVGGGPGTGKTWTIARIIAVAVDLARDTGLPVPQIALAAPTGKAAKRATESLHQARADLVKKGASGEAVETLTRLEGTTLHRLLGWRRERGRFRHDAETPLPHDLVIVDETSMVSLSLMSKLLDAVRPDARLILVGDPGQLVSIEAGTVLGDIVGPAADGQLRLTGTTIGTLGDLAGPLPDNEMAEPVEGLGDSIVLLRRPRRFEKDTALEKLTAAFRVDETDLANAVAGALSGEGIEWIRQDGDPTEIPGLQERVNEHLTRLRSAGLSGDAEAGLEAVGDFAVLCGHRRGPHGVSAWTGWSEAWMRERVEVHSLGLWYPGRPVMVTQNDYTMNLFNGDIGVTVQTDEGWRVAFDGSGGARLVAPTRLSEVSSMYAMTIHKSQGSEFEQVVVVLPDAQSPLATRELLYTAFTRAKKRLTVVGSEAALVAALGRKVARASGLGGALWG